jgi:hypothetical protein
VNIIKRQYQGSRAGCDGYNQSVSAKLRRTPFIVRIPVNPVLCPGYRKVHKERLPWLLTHSAIQFQVQWAQ